MAVHMVCACPLTKLSSFILFQKQVVDLTLRVTGLTSKFWQICTNLYKLILSSLLSFYNKTIVVLVMVVVHLQQPEEISIDGLLSPMSINVGPQSCLRTKFVTEENNNNITSSPPFCYTCTYNLPTCVVFLYLPLLVSKTLSTQPIICTRLLMMVGEEAIFVFSSFSLLLLQLLHIWS